MRSKMLGLMSIAMLGITGGLAPHGSGRQSDPLAGMNKDVEEVKSRRRRNLLRKGVREFDINGEILLARNYENALRKYNNLRCKD